MKREAFHFWRPYTLGSLWNTPGCCWASVLEQSWECGGELWHEAPCLTQGGDKWSLCENCHWAFYCLPQCSGTLCFCSYWFDLTFYDILSHETIPLLTTREMTVLGRDREEENRERLRWNWSVCPIHWWMFYSYLLLLQIKIQWQILWKSFQRKCFRFKCLFFILFNLLIF